MRSKARLNVFSLAPRVCFNVFYAVMANIVSQIVSSQTALIIRTTFWFVLGGSSLASEEVKQVHFSAGGGRADRRPA